MVTIKTQTGKDTGAVMPLSDHPSAETQWVDELIKDRTEKTKKQQDEHKLAAIAKGDAPLAAFDRFFEELNKAVQVFNKRNPDTLLGHITCELLPDSTAEVSCGVGNETRGQVTVYLAEERDSIKISYEVGECQNLDRINLHPNLDGNVYLASGEVQLSIADAIKEVLQRFIMAIAT
jgi:hypothetical protein